MYSSLQEYENLDEIFNLDCLDALPPHTRNTNVKLNENTSQNSNTDFANNFPSSDSAVGMESQVNNSSNDILRGHSVGPSSSIGMMINQEYDNLPTQEESISSQLYPAPSGYVHSNSLLSSSYSLSTQQILTPCLPTPLSKLSYYSLMQRSLMRDNVERSNTVQPMMVAEENDNVIQWDPMMSPFSGGHQELRRTLSNPFEYKINEGILSNQNLSSQILSQDSSFDVNFPHQLSTQLNESQRSVNIFSLQSLFGSYKSPPNIIHNVTSLPKSIINLYTDIKNSGLSDWSFVHALTVQTCQEFLPMSYNVTLKKCLLLSIASIDTKLDTAPIPIIAVARDCSSTYSIMNHIGNFAQRFSAPVDHLFNVSVNAEGTVEVGPVFLAFGGVCYLGDWSRLATTFSDEIKMIIDVGQYYINQTKENVKLGSAIWTYWCLTGKDKKDYGNVATLAQYFGLPIVIDVEESDDMMEYLLEEAMHGGVDIPNDVLNISYEDMKIFLNIIRNIKVTKSVDAQKLLKSYSDTIKIERKGALSVKGFQIIQQMSDSFAKLSLRNEVLVCDVVAAISIAEETFRFIVGLQLQSPSPRLHSTQDIHKVEKYFMDFHSWVENYIRKYNLD